MDVFHCEALPHLFRPPDDPIAARDIVHSIKDPATVLLIAEVVDSLAGFLGAKVVEFGPDDTVYLPRRFVYVNDMAVLPDFRGRGIGRVLLEAVEGWARRQGIGAIELTVLEFNEGARVLYERAGFDTLSRRMRRCYDRDTRFPAARCGGHVRGSGRSCFVPTSPAVSTTNIRYAGRVDDL
ncbi:MAG: GNAT family N-acetyltransferase [Chloroflexota bacterium]